MEERVLQLDYLKGVMIVLVVIFHIVAFDAAYPTLRTAVYTFHVSTFLLISGYLVNINKKPTEFGKSMLRLLIPYVAFELFYLLMLYMMGHLFHSSLSMETLSMKVVFARLFAYPLGTYWYLHTLLLCSVVYYVMFHFLKLSKMSKFIIMGLLFYGLTYVIRTIWLFPILAGSGFVWDNVIYFLIGVAIRLYDVSFLKATPASCWSVLPLCLLFSSTDNFYRGSLAGISITILVISFLLFVYDHLHKQVQSFWCYLGRNSLSIFIFSPLFLPLTKFMLPFFDFDTTILLYTIIATAFAITCCLGSALMLDKFHMSKYLFVKETVYEAL